MPGGCSSVPSACRGWSRACCAAASGAGALRMKAPHRSAPPAACRSGAIASHACVDKTRHLFARQSPGQRPANAVAACEPSWTRHIRFYRHTRPDAEGHNIISAQPARNVFCMSTNQLSRVAYLIKVRYDDLQHRARAGQRGAQGCHCLTAALSMRAVARCRREHQRGVLVDLLQLDICVVRQPIRGNECTCNGSSVTRAAVCWAPERRQRSAETAHDKEPSGFRM